MSKIRLVLPLSNDPSKVESNFSLFKGQIRIPNVWMFLNRECKNLQKGSFKIKCFSMPFWTGFSLFFLLFRVFLTQDFVLFRRSWDFVWRGVFRKLRSNVQAALQSFDNFCCLNQSCIVQTIEKLAPCCIPASLLLLLLSFLYGP